MATADDYAAWIVQNADKKGTPEFQTVAAAYQDAKSGGDAARQQRATAQATADRATYNPTNDMSTSDRTIAGIGSGLTSVLRAVGGGSLADKLGLPATAEDAAQNDAPLMATTAGKVGKVIGQAAPALLAVPFTPATVLGAIGAGVATGAATTEGGLQDRAIGAATGGIGGGLGAALPTVLRVGGGIAKGLTEPLTNAGRQRIAGRAIQQFSTDPATLASASGATTVTGAAPTLAEATRDGGIATLQRAIGTMDPDAAAAFAARSQANNAARVQTLQSIAGDPAAIAAANPGAPAALRRIAAGPSATDATVTRATAAKASYGSAFDQGIDPEIAKMMQPQVDALMSRPSVQASVAQAKSLAAEEGLNIGDNTSVQGLHYMKQALDDMVAGAPPGSNQARLIAQTSKDLGSTLEELSPAYHAARQEFLYNSVPVNRAAVGQRLADTTSGNIRDFSGNPTLQANKFSKALNDEGDLIQKSTGMKGLYGGLEDLMTPTHMQKIGGVRDELETLSNLNNAANGAGSQTAKMLASQNMLKQIAGPLGLPEGFASNVVAQNLQRLPNFVGYKAADPLIQQQLSAALLDPAKALQFLAAAQKADLRLPPSQLQQLLQRASPALAQPVSTSYSNRSH